MIIIAVNDEHISIEDDGGGVIYSASYDGIGSKGMTAIEEVALKLAKHFDQDVKVIERY